MQIGANNGLNDCNSAFIVSENRIYMYMGALRAHIHIYSVFPTKRMHCYSQWSHYTCLFAQ